MGAWAERTRGDAKHLDFWNKQRHVGVYKVGSMVELFKEVKVDWLGKRKLFLAISGAIMVLGMISLIVKGGFRYGVDFKGGTVVTVRFQEKPQVDQIRMLLRENGAADSQIQELRSGQNDILI